MEEIVRSATRLLRIRDLEHRRIIEQLVQQATGISHSHHLLLMQLYFQDFKSQKDIAKRLNISPAAVTMSLKKLEAEGYVEKNINPEDTRFNFVSLTEKGKDVVTLSIRVFEALDTKLFEGFENEELEAFMGYLQRIIDNLKRIETEQLNLSDPS